jgi:hypothetical protein
MTDFLNALREKYATPEAVVRALGLDEAILREPKEDKPMPKTPLSGAGQFLERIQPMLAQDASLGDLLELIDTLKAAGAAAEPVQEEDETETPSGGENDAPDYDDEEDTPVEPNSGLPACAGEEGKKVPVGTDNEPVSKLREHLGAKLSPEDMAEVEQLLAALSAPAADDADEESLKKALEAEELAKAEAAKAAKDEEPKLTKTAMDSAIRAAVQSVRKGAQDIRDAERRVRPYVGELAIAFDSAEQVYRHTLKVLGIKDADTIHHSALPVLLEMQPKPGARKETRVAMDSAGTKSFSTMFPEAGRIRTF